MINSCQMSLKFISLAGIVISLTACASKSTLPVTAESIRPEKSNPTNEKVVVAPSFDSVITEKYWKLIELRGQPVLNAPEKSREEHFILKTLNNKIIGYGGCNSFTGSYELLSGNRIRFSKLASTMMACVNSNYEQEFLRMFESVDSYGLKGDTLSLSKARMAPSARFQVVYFK